jgi:hypothetical protein
LIRLSWAKKEDYLHSKLTITIFVNFYFDMNISETQLLVMELFQGFSVTISLIGTGFMLYTYIIIPSIQTFSMKLVSSLVVADLFYTFANLLSFWRDNQIVCNIAGTFSTILWSQVFFGQQLLHMLHIGEFFSRMKLFIKSIHYF